MLDVVAIGMN